MDHIDCIVLGAGVVGLAAARALALSGREVVVLEAADAIGTGISSRNSEVIHAGIYYEPKSLKTSYCVRGKHLLYEYCLSRGIPHKRLGKLVVACSAEERAYLEKLERIGRANGVDDLRLIGRREAETLEPALDVHCALLSPSTGIVDTHALMLSLQGEMEQAGGMLALSSPFVEAEIAADGFVVRSGGGAPLEFSCATVVNTSGLDAPDNARAIRGMPRDLIPEQGLAKGNYFSCARKVPFSRLIYPVPEPGGLGVHLTIDMVGQGRFGPDVEWVTIRDFQVDESRKAAMLSSIRKYWPAIGEDDLVPAYAGIRPKLMDPAADFMIQGPRDHGIAGLVNLFGIESPGLTSSLAIACAVLDTLDPS